MNIYAKIIFLGLFSSFAVNEASSIAVDYFESQAIVVDVGQVAARLSQGESVDVFDLLYCGYAQEVLTFLIDVDNRDGQALSLDLMMDLFCVSAKKGYDSIVTWLLHKVFTTGDQHSFIEFCNNSAGLQLAARYGRESVVDAIIFFAQRLNDDREKIINNVDENGRTALDIATKKMKVVYAQGAYKENEEVFRSYANIVHKLSMAGGLSGASMCAIL